MTMRRSPQTTMVLAAFLKNEREWRYGYDISRETGLKSGTLYPILMRLEEHHMLETSWEAVPAVMEAAAVMKAKAGAVTAAGAADGAGSASAAGTRLGRPPRHMYKLTDAGLRYGRTLVSEAKEKVESGAAVPAFGGATGI